MTVVCLGSSCAQWILGYGKDPQVESFSAASEGADASTLWSASVLQPSVDASAEGPRRTKDSQNNMFTCKQSLDKHTCWHLFGAGSPFADKPRLAVYLNVIYPPTETLTFRNVTPNRNRRARWHHRCSIQLVTLKQYVTVFDSVPTGVCVWVINQ